MSELSTEELVSILLHDRVAHLFDCEIFDILLRNCLKVPSVSALHQYFQEVKGRSLAFPDENQQEEFGQILGKNLKVTATCFFFFFFAVMKNKNVL